MPTSKTFRMQFLTVNKTAIEISSIQLFNGSTRVDDTATITTGFETNATTLAIFKNSLPIEGQKIDVPLTTKRSTTFYIEWKFSSDVVVDSFRIGSGATEATFLNQFILSAVDSTGNYYSFITIEVDKKLAWPGPWMLSELKPVGDCFPGFFSNSMIETNRNANRLLPVFVSSDLRTINFLPPNKKDYEIFYQDWAGSSFAPCFFFPGIFTSGKFYFEVEILAHNTYGFANDSWNKFFVNVLPVENKTFKYLPRYLAAEKVAGVTVNNAATAPSTMNGTILTFATKDNPSYTTFAKGYFQGILIDFDQKKMFFVNPKWKKDPGQYEATNINWSALSSTANGFYIFFSSLSSLSVLQSYNLKFNFGQSPFVNQLPAGSSNGLGPRWKEEIINLPSTLKQTYFLEDSIVKALTNPIPLKEILPPFFNISASKIAGGYYIKGFVTRNPNIEIKEFRVTLISNEDSSVVASCIASSSGAYEFFGIPYGAYTVLSIDILSNTVSETIGPVYPKEII